MAQVANGIPSHAWTRVRSLWKQRDRSWLFVVAIVGSVLLIGSPVHLKCKRAEMHGSVTCTKQTRLLWILPLPEERIVDVRGAHLASIGGDEYCDPCYRVELETGQGNIPLRGGYTNGSYDMELVVEKVNSFAHSNTQGTLQISDPGVLSIDTLFTFVAWLIFATVVGFVWEKIKLGFGKIAGSWTK